MIVAMVFAETIAGTITTVTAIEDTQITTAIEDTHVNDTKEQIAGYTTKVITSEPSDTIEATSTLPTHASNEVSEKN